MTPNSSSDTLAHQALSNYLHSADGQVVFTIPDGILPGFLIDAFNATIRSDLTYAAHLIGSENEALVDHMMSEKWPGALLASVILATVLQRVGQLDAAAQRYEAAVAIDPHPLILNELGEIYLVMGLPSRALHYHQRAMQADPQDDAIRANYALGLIKAGHVQEGVDLLEALVRAGRATSSAHSALLLFLHYLPQTGAQKVLELSRHWGSSHAPEALVRRRHANDPDPDRPLRIGYLSADFRAHSVAYNFEAVLDGHDRNLFTLYGYGQVAQPDKVTERLAAKFDQYRSVVHLDDRQLVHQIERDGVDILVSLAGHTQGNRLQALAYKPAPIQVDNGGISSTGMTQIDYRLSDPWLDPPEAQSLYVEAFAYVDGGYVCYRAPEDAPQPSPLPALQNGYVTFCSFNNHLKMNDDTVALWAQVLQVCPGSRMLLKCQMGGDAGVRDLLLDRFHRQGIARDRVSFLPWQSSHEHLLTYHQVDIALDTYPFNGCVTTLEGLWMGVPVVSLSGSKYISRVTLTLLHPLDMSCLCAESPEQYVAKARALAGNLPALARIRAGLRTRMQASPLCDAKRYGRALEKAYRRMWQRWCHEQTSGQKDAMGDSIRGD